MVMELTIEVYHPYLQLSLCLYQRGVFVLFQLADPFIPSLPMTSSQ
jgi:hypothetical protein